MLVVLSTSASVEKQGPYDPDGLWEINETKQDPKLTNGKEETMEGRESNWNNQALGLKTVDREGKSFGG